MITSTRAIVLHQVKYSETSVIATLFTEDFGRQSFMVNGIRNPRSKQKAGLLQPLSQLEIEAYYKPGRDVNRLKEFRPVYVYQSLPFDPVKRSVSLFLAEILLKLLRNEASDPALFEFIVRSLQVYDDMKQGTANFHLWFIARLLGFLGLQPQNNYDENYRWFDMKNGKFLLTRPLHPNSPNPETSQQLSALFSLPIEKLQLLELNGTQRNHLLDVMIEYYSIHIERMGKINSLPILSQLFH